MSSAALICLAVVAAVVAFVFFGTQFMSKLIDEKIGDIRVNVPKIKVRAPHTPPPPIVFHISEDDKGRIVLNSNASGATTTAKSRKVGQTQPPPHQKLTHPNAIQLNEPFLSVRFDDDDAKAGSDDVCDVSGGEFDAPVVVDTSEPPTHPRVLVGCTTDADCNVVNGDGRNVCKSDGTCSCVGGGSGTFCHYGPTAYRDPKDMTPDELRRFKAKYRNTFTLQDYKNWLMLYKSDPENLRAHHRRNLRILLQGGQLTPKDVPSMRIRPPTDASDYFQKMYRGGNIAVQFPDNDSPFVAANYKDYNDFVPPENVASSWITGVVNAYAEGKDDARALDWYVRPDSTVGVEEERVGDVYQRFVEKHHSLADIRAMYERTLHTQKKIDTQDLNTF